MISVFLESLSKSRHKGVAVIFSGLDKDGAEALAEFKRNGGITIVQEPKTAKSPQMPEAAIDTGTVDYVLAPAQIPAQLESIVKDLFRSRVAQAAAK